MFDLNDSSQAFELTKPLPQQSAAAAASRQLGPGAAAGRAADMAALADQAAALIIQPQAAVRPIAALLAPGPLFLGTSM